MVIRGGATAGRPLVRIFSASGQLQGSFLWEGGRLLEWGWSNELELVMVDVNSKVKTVAAAAAAAGIGVDALQFGQAAAADADNKQPACCWC